jgi:hypothetical protein
MDENTSKNKSRGSGTGIGIEFYISMILSLKREALRSPHDAAGQALAHLSILNKSEKAWERRRTKLTPSSRGH